MNHADAAQTKTRVLSARSLLLGATMALVYALTAYASLLLAIPPGYASPVWPAAGVALAGVLLCGYRALWGVFAGSLLINLHVALGNGADLSWSPPVQIAILIASGALVQAAASAWLLRRFLHFPNSLENAGDISLLALLGGPVGCVINASWGPYVLHTWGSLPMAALWSTGLTWWIGDALGVVCFTPMLLLVFGSHATVQRGRKLLVAGVQLAVFALVILGVITLRNAEQNKRASDFAHSGRLIKSRLLQSIHQYENVLHSVGGLYAASTHVSARDFANFSGHFFSEYPGLFGLSFNAHVLEQERSAFEARLQAEGFSDFGIKDTTPSGGFITAPPRTEYYPVTYVAPLESNHAALGLDVYANDLRRPAMDLALAKQRAQATTALHIVQAAETQGVLVYYPLSVPDQTVKSGTRHVGFAVGIFIFSQMLKDAAILARSDLLDIALSETSPDGSQNEIFVARQGAGRSYGDKYTLKSESDLDVLGVRWHLRLSESDLAVAKNDGSSIWFSLIGGCLFSALAGMMFLTVTGRTEVVTRLVEEKTREVQAKAAQLERSNQELTALAKEAESANVAKGQFLAAMSHEIRTPMNGLLGVMHLLEDGLSAQKLKLLHAAQQSANSLLVLINDILDFSKIEAGKMELEVGEFDVVALAEEVVQLHAASCREKNVQLSLSLLPSAARLGVGDIHRIRQVLSNLLANAVKFTQEGEISLSCSYETSDSSRYLVFGVHDTGIGITEEALSRLFESFTQADASTTRKFGGSGLGLSICKRLVELMGGTIWVESELNRGSHFYFKVPQEVEPASVALHAHKFKKSPRILLTMHPDKTRELVATWLEHWGAKVAKQNADEPLPKEQADYDYVLQETPEAQAAQAYVLMRTGKDMDATSRSVSFSQPLCPSQLAQALFAETSASKPSPPLALDFQNKHVLLVDDNRTNLLVAGALLRKGFNIQPDLASGGIEAIEKLKHKHYDLVLMDCMMPDIDGYQATQALRRGDAGNDNQRTPVIALTANAMPSDRDLCFDAGMNDFLSKPIDPIQLREALLRWIGNEHSAA